MEQHSKTFHLRVEREGSVATLEAILAVVRRGGLRLHSLRMAPARHGVEAHLHVDGDEDALQLCRMRLCNVIGIVKLRVLAGGREPFRPRHAACSYGSATPRMPESPHQQEERKAS